LFIDNIIDVIIDIIIDVIVDGIAVITEVSDAVLEVIIVCVY